MSNKKSFFDLIFNFRKCTIFKFLLVGFLNAILLLFLLFLFTTFFSIHYITSSIIAYEITIILGFIMHDNWTFKSIPKTSKIYTRLILFNVFSLLGLVLNTVILYALTELYLHYILSGLIAISITFIFNYSVSKKISFRK